MIEWAMRKHRGEVRLVRNHLKNRFERARLQPWRKRPVNTGFSPWGTPFSRFM